jgi:hypothetical protein
MRTMMTLAGLAGCLVFPALASAQSQFNQTAVTGPYGGIAYRTGYGQVYQYPNGTVASGVSAGQLIAPSGATASGGRYGVAGAAPTGVPGQTVFGSSAGGSLTNNTTGGTATATHTGYGAAQNNGNGTGGYTRGGTNTWSTPYHNGSSNHTGSAVATTSGNEYVGSTSASGNHGAVSASTTAANHAATTTVTTPKGTSTTTRSVPTRIRH